MNTQQGWRPARLVKLLDEVMQRTGLTQKDLAGLIPADASVVTRWRDGTNRPGYERIQALGSALEREHPDLGVGARELLEAAGYPSPTAGDRHGKRVNDMLHRVERLPIGPEDRRVLQKLVSSPDRHTRRTGEAALRYAENEPDPASRDQWLTSIRSDVEQLEAEQQRRYDQMSRAIEAMDEYKHAQ